MSVDGEQCFFFQAEDGIRDSPVTGVQTCALPISSSSTTPLSPSPTISIFPASRDVAQLGSAPEWGSGGRRFESGRPDLGKGLAVIIYEHGGVQGWALPFSLYAY